MYAINCVSRNFWANYVYGFFCENLGNGFLIKTCRQIYAEYRSLLLQNHVRQWIDNSAIPGASHMFLHRNFTLHISIRACIRVCSPLYINY